MKLLSMKFYVILFINFYIFLELLFDSLLLVTFILGGLCKWKFILLNCYNILHFLIDWVIHFYHFI